MGQVRRNNQPNVPANGFLLRESKNTFRTLIPGLNDAGKILADDRIFRAVNARSQWAAALTGSREGPGILPSNKASRLFAQVQVLSCAASNLLKMEPAIRIERTTCGLRNRCSTN
jgi:hypothetical protein